MHAMSWEDVPARGRCWLSIQGKVGLGAVWLECAVRGHIIPGWVKVLDFKYN